MVCMLMELNNPFGEEEMIPLLGRKPRSKPERLGCWTETEGLGFGW